MWRRETFISSCSNFVSFTLTWTNLSGLLSHPFHPPSRLDQQLNWRDRCYRASLGLRLTRPGYEEMLRKWGVGSDHHCPRLACLSFLKLSFCITEHNAYVHLGSSWSLTYDLEPNRAVFGIQPQVNDMRKTQRDGSNCVPQTLLWNPGLFNRRVTWMNTEQ